MVNQDPVLFSTSIRDNIAYGLPDCPLDQIQDAARKAGAHDFISKLKSGYDTGKLTCPHLTLRGRLRDLAWLKWLNVGACGAE